MACSSRVCNRRVLYPSEPGAINWFPSGGETVTVKELADEVKREML